MKSDDQVYEELERIRHAAGGILTPAAVVQSAAADDSPLHDKFEWDDTVAGREYRLWQARELIQVTVRMLPQSEEPVRVYVSLSEDQKRPGGGYRAITDVMADDDHRNELLSDALRELKRIRRKYATLNALAQVFEAIDATVPQLETAAKPMAMTA